MRAVNLVKREDVLTSKEGQRFRKRLFGSWWSETGKAGKPRGLVQAIDHKVLEDAYQQLLHEFPKMARQLQEISFIHWPWRRSRSQMCTPLETPRQ